MSLLGAADEIRAPARSAPAHLTGATGAFVLGGDFDRSGADYCISCSPRPLAPPVRFGKSSQDRRPEEVTMIAVKNEQYYDKLTRRRSETTRTLQHVQREQRTVDENKDWIDKAAYESRCRLLGSLADWYANETARINAALMRITEGRYGVCLGCRAPIDARLLETIPETAFCAECQRSREKPTDP
jgi:DnaK suppressor protein